MIVMNALPASILTSSVFAKEGHVSIRPLSVRQAKDLLIAEGVESAVGHADTAAIFSNLLGVEIPENRRSVDVSEMATYGVSDRGRCFLAGLYQGPRLLEGSTTLPEGASIAFFLVGDLKVTEGFDYSEARSGAGTSGEIY